MKPRWLQPILVGVGLGAALGLAGALHRRQLSAPADGDELEALTKDELYRRAQDAEIHGRSSMSKDELIRALRTA